MSAGSSIEVIAQVLRCAGVLVPNSYEDYRTYESQINDLAAEIDTALGGLTPEWRAPGFLSADEQTARRAAATKSEPVSLRWVSGWAPEVVA